MVEEDVTRIVKVDGVVIKSESGSKKIWARKIVICPQISQDGLHLVEAQIDYTLPDGTMLKTTLGDAAQAGLDVGLVADALSDLFKLAVKRDAEPKPEPEILLPPTETGI